MNYKKRLLIIFLFILFTNTAYSLPIFPGAQGFGTETRAAYGLAPGTNPTVYTVTNLNPSGGGSLKACIDASGPRVCIFEVSGTITLTDNLVISNPYITIPGQTAPSPGITIRGAAIWIATHDVLVQHLRVRVGDGPGHNPENRDGLSVASFTPPYNIVFDHCSVSWAIDENIQLWYPCHDIVIQWCITSEALHDSLHPKGPHSKGMIIGPGAERISIHHNLFAHNVERNPLISVDTESEVINNVVYNWQERGLNLGNCEPESGERSNVIGNYFRKGPSSNNNAFHISYCWTHAKVFVLGNIGPGRPIDSGDEWSLVNNDVGTQIKSTEPALSPSGITTQQVLEAYDSVLANVGARPADRDQVDTRIVNDVIKGTGRIIDSQNDVGGWPDLAENYRALTLPDNLHGDDNSDDYTNLEEWLHEYARQVEVSESILGDVDLDNDVDLTDLILVAIIFSKTSSEPEFNPNADFNSNDIIDLPDLITVAIHFGQTTT